MRKGSGVRVQGSEKARLPECRLSLRERTFFRGAKDDNRARRRGASLVEMLVVISVMSLIMSAVAVSMHGMYRADRAARLELQSSANLARLADRLRADVHAARAAEAKAATLSLQLGETRSVTYAFSPERIERVVKDADQTVHQDSFQLSPDATVKWQMANQGSVKFVVQIIDRSAGKPVRIEARLAADNRFQKIPAEGSEEQP